MSQEQQGSAETGSGGAGAAAVRPEGPTPVPVMGDAYSVACLVCGAEPQEACSHLEAGTVHFARSARWSNLRDAAEELADLYKRQQRENEEAGLTDLPRTGAQLIAAERDRQVAALGWSAAHDLELHDGELTQAAVHYLAPFLLPWPWHDNHPDEVAASETVPQRLRRYAKAGALLAAEMDRMQAADAADPDPEEAP